ncbi:MULTISPECIES: ACP S-malonyltransferase [Bacillus cereus group]|uniref:[acyl-carrier-protein] S-malonyltransferase n=1 Tax=Bacillus thuringiensis TaxID=1428 RepID=A0AB33B6A6_BACTU|nr:ACP S-malonyltransferase [Bacillus thuringiensis]AJG79665.1 malonyl CoA-acyl carrier protein transacylase [Bacillus thuringiensis]EEM74084.1 Malonyl CoA-acyl carrier protein transacylase [Bacillus thuringiensis serovar pondicheriensis BGSC 4BA1]
MKAFVFPGQGSQHVGMGAFLFDKYKELTEKSDEILGYSIKTLCLEDPHHQLNQTQYTQPALYVVNALQYLNKIEEDGKRPDFVAGHSLGEYNALFAAGAFDFETGLKLVQKRGELMSKARGGGMAAIIGLDAQKIESILAISDLNSIQIANYNSPSQIVISGLNKEILMAEKLFADSSAKMYIPLKVSGAFHSNLMNDAKKVFEKYLDKYKFFDLSIPVIANVNARPYRQSMIKENLSNQITNSVNWTNSIRYLMGMDNIIIQEVGPGNVLTKLVKTIQEESTPLEVEQIEKNDQNKNAYTEQYKISQHFPKVVKGDRWSEQDNHNFEVGSTEFMRDYNLKYPYVVGGMHKGITSEQLILKLGENRILGFLGTNGLDISKIENAICNIKNKFTKQEPYGINIVYNPNNLEMENTLIDLCIKHDVRNIEVSNYIHVTPALVKFRVDGIRNRGQDSDKRIIAKVSRPDIAELFLSPAPEPLLKKMLSENQISNEEASILRKIPVADDICVQGDCGGHTDQGALFAILPSIMLLKGQLIKKYNYQKEIRIGAAGGIGTPYAAAATFMLGADFIQTGSINQCTVESGISNHVKDMLSKIDVQDTDYAPSSEFFEIGGKVQVLKKGVFFPARAKKLYDIYRKYQSLDEIDEQTKVKIQEKYFKKSFNKVFEEAAKRYSYTEIQKAQKNPKYKMSLIFRWYLEYTLELALRGDENNKVDYQVYCGPALGSFNQWVKGTNLENWQNRHVDIIADRIMLETVDIFHKISKKFLIRA